MPGRAADKAAAVAIPTATAAPIAIPAASAGIIIVEISEVGDGGELNN